MALHVSPGSIPMLLALAPAALLVCLTTMRGMFLLAADKVFASRR